MTPNWVRFEILKRTFLEGFDQEEKIIYYEPTDTWVKQSYVFDVNEVRIMDFSGYDILYQSATLGIRKVKSGVIITFDNGSVIIVSSTIDKFIEKYMEDYDTACYVSDAQKAIEESGNTPPPVQE